MTAQAQTLAVASLAFSPDGSMIALSALDGGIEIRDVRSGRLRQTPCYRGPLALGCVLSGRKMLAVGQFDGDGQLYSTETWAPLGRRLEAHTQRITNVEFSYDGRTLATSSADGTVLLWDVETQEPIGSSLPVEPDTFVSMALSPDGTRLFAVSTGSQGVRLASRSGGMEAPRLLRRWARAE